MADRPYYRPLSPVEVEERIVALSDALADGTAAYADRRRAAAEAEADYKAAYHRAVLRAAAEARGRNAEERKAWASTREDVEPKYRAHLIADAALDAAKDSQQTLRTRLDAERTLAANLRSQT